MSTRKALLFSFIDRYSGLVIAVGSSMIIARLLTPADMGVFSVAMALLMLANTVRDMGAGQYLVQVKELTPERITAVWTLQFGIGAGLGTLVAALAFPAAAFYDESRMAPLLGIMALSYFVNPIGSITYALLMRDMRFQHVAVMRFCANLAGAIVSVGLAMNNFGPLSLAWGNLATVCVNAVVAQFFRDRAVPWGLSFRGAREVLSFGGKITGTSIISSLQNSTPDFALGKIQDMVAAGLFSRSNGLVSMFNRLVLDAMYSVAIPALAAQARNDQDPAPTFLRALSYITVLNWVFAVNLIALAQPVTELLYGTQWDKSAQLTRLLAIASAVLAPTHICGAVNIARGRADNVLRATLVTAACAVPATLIGATISLEAVGALLIAAAVISTSYWLTLTLRMLQLSWSETLDALWRSAVVTLGCSAVPVALVWTMGLHPNSILLQVALAAIGGSASLLASLVLFKHPLVDELQRLMPEKS